MKNKWIIVLLALILALVLFGAWIKTALKIDACLDQGGVWDERTEQCKYE